MRVAGAAVAPTAHIAPKEDAHRHCRNGKCRKVSVVWYRERLSWRRIIRQ